MDAPRNTLPDAAQFRVAIHDWFSGGPIAELIVNVCRRQQANLTESAALAQRMSSRLALGKDYVTDEVVSQQLEAVRAVALSNLHQREEEAKSPNPAIGSGEWYRRATERAQRNSWAENPYKNWQWEKPKAQQRSWT